MLTLQPAKPEDLSHCVEILRSGRAFQRQQGFTQWTDDFPDPAVIADMRRFVKLNKEYKELGALMEARAKYIQLIRQFDEAKELFATENDVDMRDRKSVV